MKSFFPGILLAGIASAAPIPHGSIDDKNLTDQIVHQMDSIAADTSVPAAGILEEQLKRQDGVRLHLKRPEGTPPATHEDAASSVAIVGICYKCDSCPDWHIRSTATAWIAAADGVLVTNYHVLSNMPANGRACVSLKDGRIFPIKEILASDQVRDIAVFRIDAAHLKPLAVGPDAPVGSNLHLISHPQGNHYVYTGGFVQRYTLRTTTNSPYYRLKHQKGRTEPIAWLVSSCDYSLGSSGGGIYNDHGEIVGMVSSTTTLYTTPVPTPVPLPPSGTENGDAAVDTVPTKKPHPAEADGVAPPRPESRPTEPVKPPAQLRMMRHPQMIMHHCVAGYSLREILYGE